MPGGGSKPGERRGPGRKGVPNKDKSELRSLVQERVHDHTIMLQDRICRRLQEENPDWSVEQCRAEAAARQPIDEEYDPVANLAMLASDTSVKRDLRRQADSDAAQYLRPKLKTIEHLDDPLTREAELERQTLAERIMVLLTSAGAGGSSAKPAAPPAPPPTDEEEF